MKAPDSTLASLAGVTWALLIIAAIYYVFLLTDGTFDLFGAEAMGLVFNDMALRLLHWDFTSSPDIIGVEGFVRDGRTYTYFGIFPALIRLPLVPLLDLHTVQVGRLSCWIALSLSAWAQASLLMLVCGSLPRTAVSGVLYACALFALLFTGPQLAMTHAAYLYIEPITWSTLFTLCFLRIGVARLLPGGALRRRDWCGLACFAGLGFCTRLPAGLGMMAALAALALVDGIARLRVLARGEAPAARLRDYLDVVRNHPCWSGVLAFLPFAAVMMIVNAERWGNPFTLIDFDLYKYYADHPGAMELHRRFGEMSPLYIPFGIAVYVFGPPFYGKLLPLFQEVGVGIGYPRSLLIVTSSTLLVLCIFGYRSLLMRGVFRPTQRALLLALMVAPAVQLIIVLCSRAINFRYRYEFIPLLAVGAVFGVRGLAVTMLPAWRTRIAAALVVVTIGNVAVAHLDVLQAKLASFARSSEERDRIILATVPFSKWFADQEDLERVHLR
jgi:hypothetical protein